MSDIQNKLLNSKSGNAVIVAMDHGLQGKVFPESRNPRITAEKVLEGRPDGVLLSPMLIYQFADLFARYTTVKPIATLDCFPRLHGPAQIFDLDSAVSIGAKAVKCLLIFGQSDSEAHLGNMRYVVRLAEQARKKDIPFIVEAVLWGQEIPPEKKNDPELINIACRVAYELGANLIKTEYTGDEESFRDITSNCPIPILVLGGPKAALEDVFQRAKGAMDAGARGVVFGRNVFQHESPAKMVRALNSLVHGGASPREALQMIG